MAGSRWLIDKLRGQVDYIGIVGTFVAGFGIIFLLMWLNRNSRRSSTLSTNLPPPTPPSSPATTVELESARREVKRLTKGVDLLQSKLENETQRGQRIEHEREEFAKQLQAVNQELDTQKTKLEETLKEWGRDKLFDLGCKYKVEPQAWHVQIKYF